MRTQYAQHDKFGEIVLQRPALLHMVNWFGLLLGQGDKSIKDQCEAAGVDAFTFLEVLNFVIDDKLQAHLAPNSEVSDFSRLHMATLLKALRASHHTFLEYRFPQARRKILSSLDYAHQNDVSFLILKFFDEYMREVRQQIEIESQRIYAKIEALLEGAPSKEFNIEQSVSNGDELDKKLWELKNIIIKYSVSPSMNERNLLCDALLTISQLEHDFRIHQQIEKYFLFPTAQWVEQQRSKSSIQVNEAESEAQNKAKDLGLSLREMEIITAVVKGRTNKEIAEELYISIYTVLTHRKNIAKKLDIHSVPALTIFAITNGIVSIEDLNK